MKMVFFKENNECKVYLKGSDGANYEFTYIKLIEMLYGEKKLSESEFKDYFTEEEKESIDKLVLDINSRTNELLLSVTGLENPIDDSLEM